MLGFVPLVSLMLEHVAWESKPQRAPVAGCDARAYWLGTLCGAFCLLLGVALCFSMVAAMRSAYGGPYKRTRRAPSLATIGPSCMLRPSPLPPEFLDLGPRSTARRCRARATIYG